MNRSAYGFWPIVALIAGAIVGYSMWIGQLQEYSDAPPPGWTRENSPVPYRESSLQGTEPPAFGEWGLDFYRAIYPTDRTGNYPLSVTARIPNEGMLEIWYSAPPIRKRMGDRWLNICTMSTPQYRNGRNNRQRTTNTSSDPRCSGSSDFGVGVLLSRLSGQPYLSVVTENSAGRQEVSCSNMDTVVETDEPLTITLSHLDSTLSIEVNGVNISCQTSVGDRIPMLRSGLRQVLISDLTSDGSEASFLSNWIMWAYMLGAGLLVTGFGWVESKHNASPRSIFWTTIPLLFGVVIGQWDAKVMIEDLRASWVSPYWLLPTLTVLPVAILKLFTATWRECSADHQSKLPLWIGMGVLTIANLLFYSQGWIGMIACLIVQGLAWSICTFWNHASKSHIPILWGTLGGVLMMGVNAFHWAGTLWATIGGVSIGLLIVANKFVVPRFNLWSLLFVSLTISSAEISLRATKAGLQWSNKGSNTENNEIFGWVRQANESFALFEEGKHTQYPDKGFPVEISTSNHKTRVIAFGGSTTGGAFQNDNLDEFYPALIDVNLRKNRTPFEVLNQGVGGWTTWHIEQYIQQKQQLLKPDVITLYVGHNDILTSVPMPYKELYPLWQRQSSSKLAKQLSSLRLYQAFKYILVSIRGASNKVAVPIDDARANLESIIQLYPNTPIVLGSEGLSPEPGILFPYNQMMQTLADEHKNVSYVETAEALSTFPPHEVFLDDCHLTKYGHQIVAKLFADKIQEVTAK